MIVTLTGNNSFQLRQELDKRKKRLISKYGDLSYEKINGDEAEYERLVEAAHSLPFLVSEKLVVMYAPGSNKKFQEKINDILDAVPDTTELVIVEPKIDKRSSYFKVLKLKTEYMEFNELDARELSNWVVQYAKNGGGKIDLVNAQYLVERVGTNQRIIANEVDKLLTNNNIIDRDIIDVLTERTPQSTIFELLEAAFAGNTKKTLDLYKEQRALKVEPQQIVAMLAWQLHVLAVIKAGKEKSSNMVAKEARLNPFVVGKSMKIAGKINVVKLKKLIADALELDVKLKTENVDADDALNEYLLRLSTS